MNWCLTRHCRIYTVAILAVTLSSITAASESAGVRDELPMISKRSLLGTVTVSTDGNTTYSYNTEDAECKEVNELEERDRCTFAETIESCETDGLINYIQFIYCQVPSNLIPLAMIMLCLWLLYLFIFMGATAQEYFCPSLQIISELLRLSQNVAGVTLLAFGNGAADIFSAIAVIKEPDPRKASLAIGALFGAGMFVTTVVVGAVSMVKPFTLTQRPFLRDIIFYLIGVFWTFVILWQNKVTIYSAVGFVSMYVIYVLVVIFGRIVYQKWKKLRAANKSSENVPDKVAQEPLSTAINTSPINSPVSVHTCVSIADPEQNEIERLKPETPAVRECERLNVTKPNQLRATAPAPERHREGQLLLELEDRQSNRPRTGSVLQNLVAAAAFPAAPADKVLDVLASSVNDTRRHRMRVTIAGALSNDYGGDQGVALRSHALHPLQEVASFHAPPTSIDDKESSEINRESTLLIQPNRSASHPFTMLLKAFWPFGEDFTDLGPVGKIYEIIKVPAAILLTLTVPVVDHEKPNDNWNKWLSVLHCVTAPLFFVLVTKLGFYNIGGVFPVWTLVLILSTIIAMIVACTSNGDKQPVYHCVFAWIGFVVSVIWIHTLAGELVSVLQTFGAIFSVSDGILGLTFLAWGNSIGDAVSNITMARQGFPRMAVGACFGSPLMNLLIAIGVASIIKMVTDSTLEFPIYFTQVEMVAVGFLMLCLASTVLVVTTLCFKVTRYYGMILFCCDRVLRTTFEQYDTVT
ncbi:hypothetical protein EMCRGX_G007883 [Ephydatia muelleri]